MIAFGFSVHDATVQTLGWTLIDFVWQGSLVAAALAMLDALGSRRRPQARYLAGCVALVVLLASPIATFLTRAATTHAEHAAAGGHSPSIAVASSSRPLPGAAQTSGASRMPLPDARAAHSARSERTPGLGLRTPVDELSRATLPWLVALWGIGVVLLSLRLLGGWWWLTRIRCSTLNVPLADWQERLTHLAHRMNVTRPVRLLRSGLVTVPSAIGWLRPVILLPASTLTGLGAAQIEAILLHELAHIRRHDYLVNLLQSAIETLLFYHPAVWWVSRRVREERELCCDDLAVRASGDAVSYAEALFELERLRGAGPPLALAANGGSLAARIARLLGGPQRSPLESARGLAWPLVASLVVLVGIAASAVGGNARARTQATSPRSLGPARSFEAQVARQLRALDLAPRAAAELESLASVAETPLAVATAVDVNAMDDEPADVAADAADGTQRRPFARFSVPEWERLVQSGVAARYLNDLDDAGLGDLTAEEIVRLVQHGVSAEYAGGVRRALGHPTVDDLVRLASHGVPAEYASMMSQQVGPLGVEDLVQLATHGVSTEYVEVFRELGLEGLSALDLVRLANSGVTLEWFASLRWSGYADLTVDRAIELRNSGLSADDAAALRMVRRDRLTLDELRTLQNQGVDVAYAATMLGMVRKDLTVDQLVALRNQGVTVEDVATLNVLGYSKVPPGELITLRQNGVAAEFIAGMAAAGYRHLPVGDLVRLSQSGVTAEFVESVREAGYGTPTVSELIRYAQNGIPSRVEP